MALEAGIESHKKGSPRLSTLLRSNVGVSFRGLPIVNTIQFPGLFNPSPATRWEGYTSAKSTESTTVNSIFMLHLDVALLLMH